MLRLCAGNTAAWFGYGRIVRGPRKLVERTCVGPLLIALALLPQAAQPARAACTTNTPCVAGPEDLGTFGGTYSYPTALSSDGSVVAGFAYTAGNASYHAFRWEGGAMADLGTFGGTYSYATALSSDGSVVAGFAYTAGNAAFHAFRWEGGTMADLGTLGGTYSAADAISSDGSVVAGFAYTAGNTEHAFRWEGGTMADLGTLGGTYSHATALSNDGSVVAGYASTAGDAAYHAFRWEGGAMADLGTVGGTYSYATALSSDGSVVAGYAHTAGDAAYHAFRWEGGTMADLGTLGGTYSYADALSSDGSVVVGWAYTATNEQHAFRWEGGTMADLGTLGGSYSEALALSADGSVVVGYAYTAGNTEIHAFRWTAATNTQDLNTLLSAAGVNMAGITLVNATGISANGQFVVGSGNFSGEEHAYLVRYDDGAQGPIGGITSFSAVQSSINDLSDSRRGVMAQQHGLLSPLLGNDKPIEDVNEAGVFAAAGSASGGGFARLSNGTGLSLLAGMSWAQEDYADAEIKNGVSGALALRYVFGGSNLIQPFVEGGGWLTRDAELEFSRTYDNGAGTATGTGTSNGDLTYLYGRAGLLFSATKIDQLVVSAEVGREKMEVGAYSEQFDATNPFEAHVAAGTDVMDLGKLRLQWSHTFSDKIDTTLWVAGVRDFDWTSDLVATVPGFGLLTPTGHDESSWIEYGARVGYELTETVTLDAFVNGVSGDDNIDTRVHGGADVRFEF